MNTTIATTTGLTGRGFSHLAAADVRAWLGDDALIGWPAFAASWNDLEEDSYLADRGRFRKRRYAVFEINASGGIERQTHQAHRQHVAMRRHRRIERLHRRDAVPHPVVVEEHGVERRRERERPQRPSRLVGHGGDAARNVVPPDERHRDPVDAVAVHAFRRR